MLDLTQIPAGSAATGIHWPTSQATSLQNLDIKMSAASGTQHVGLFIEQGESGANKKKIGLFFGGFLVRKGGVIYLVFRCQGSG